MLFVIHSMLGPWISHPQNSASPASGANWRSTRPAPQPKFEHPLARPVPVRWHHRADHLPHPSAQLLIRLLRSVFAKTPCAMHQPHRRRRKPRRRAATAIEQRERLRAIAQQIKILPPDQRAALVLREFEGLSYEQVADVLQTTSQRSKAASTAPVSRCSRRRWHGARPQPGPAALRRRARHPPRTDHRPRRCSRSCPPSPLPLLPDRAQRLPSRMGRSPDPRPRARARARPASPRGS